MPIKAFATGVTGYIGGDAFYQINKSFPDSIEWTCLVRSSARGAAIAAQYPSVRLVYGDLDKSELLEQEASHADLVCNWADADHPGAAHALLKGLETRSASTKQNVYLIHTSGGAITGYPDINADRYGEPTDQVFNDWDGVMHMVNDIPDNAPHRDVDKTIQSHTSDRVKTAIVCPPCIYGQGRGPANNASVQIPGLIRLTLSQRRGLQVGQGKNQWSFVHVADLSDVYSGLVGKALPDTPKSSDDAAETEVWGQRGYFFAATSRYEWGNVASMIADEAHTQGLLDEEAFKTEKVQSLSKSEIEKLKPFGAVLWGTNAQTEAIRAKKVLGWDPKGKPSVQESIAESARLVAREQELVTGHAAKAAGTA